MLLGNLGRTWEEQRIDCWRISIGGTLGKRGIRMLRWRLSAIERTYLSPRGFNGVTHFVYMIDRFPWKDVGARDAPLRKGVLSQVRRLRPSTVDRVLSQVRRLRPSTVDRGCCHMYEG